VVELTFITGSKGKFSEALSIFPHLKQLDVNLPELQHTDAREVIKYKLLEAKKHGLDEFIVEDTSVCLTSLNGLPGPFIKWFLKTIGVEGIAEIAHLKGDTEAQAITIIGYMSKDGSIHYFEGVVEGNIVNPRGTYGFGWDPIFQPKRETRTFGEMTPEEKSNFSMRLIALNKLKAHIG